MIRAATRQELDLALARLRTPGARLALVPTMGFLHEGHASLFRLARKEADRVVVSLFVNPKQFGPNEDLDRYPRDLERDLAICRQEGVDLLFTPSPDVVYPPGFRTSVAVADLTAPMCGQTRPGHFTGVTTVLARLFGMIRPDMAVFGQKDFQQWRVVAQMVEDLALPIDIRRAPIVREADGLALSSRNTYLSPDERHRALALSRALAHVVRAYLDGVRSAEALLQLAQKHLEGLDVEYVDLRDVDRLQPVETLSEPAVMALAAKIGRTRLIDNALLAPESPDLGLVRLLEGALL